MWRVFIALVALGGAGFLPAPPFSSVETSWHPPPRAAVSMAALGREQAAGSILWFQASQLIGSGAYTAKRYPGLEAWLEEVFAHNPRLLHAYFLGSVLLLTDRDRSQAMDRILARAEAEFPDNWEVPFYRGIGAYFGRFDNLAAANHFERASRGAGAPAYLPRFVQRLRTDARDCADVMRSILVLGEGQAADLASQLGREAGGVYVRCVVDQVERAAAAFKLNEEAPPTLDLLVARGYLRAVPEAPPGRCWVMSASGAVTLEPCP
jgi:hypothetical protein